MARTYRRAWFPVSRNDPTGVRMFGGRVVREGNFSIVMDEPYTPKELGLKRLRHVLVLRDGKFQGASRAWAKQESSREVRRKAHVMVQMGLADDVDVRRSPK